jgi:hypothetical protein
MTFDRNRFATPVSPKELSKGDLLIVYSDRASWLGVRVADSEAGWPMAMLFAGPDLHGAPTPFLVDLRGIDEGLGRIAGERMLIEPWAGDSIAQPGVAQHGSLLIDHDGEAWLVYRLRTRPGDQHLSLSTFQVGTPAKPTIAYPTWRIMLKDGPAEHELVSFQPGRIEGPQAQWSDRHVPASGEGDDHGAASLNLP